MPDLDDLQDTSPDQDQDSNQQLALTGDDLAALHSVALRLQAAGDPRVGKLWAVIEHQSGGGDGTPPPKFTLTQSPLKVTSWLEDLENDLWGDQSQTESQAMSATGLGTNGSKPPVNFAQANSPGKSKQQPFALPASNDVGEFFGGAPQFNPDKTSDDTPAWDKTFPPLSQEGFQLPAADDTRQFFGGSPKFYPNAEPGDAADQNIGAPSLNFTRQKPPAFLPALSAPVGPGQPNRRSDILLVQRLYNQMLNEGRLATANREMAAPELLETGVYDAATADAIRAVQQRNFNGPQNPFGIVTPDGSLFKTLAETVTGPNSAASWISPEMQETARIMLPNAPQKNLNTYLPPLLKALHARRLDDPAMVEYALATINTENDSFKPVSEEESSLNTTPGGSAFNRYNGRGGNIQPGDAERFRGRGLIQLWGRANYNQMTRELNANGINIDLIKNPELANDDRYAPAIFAQFLADREGRIRNALGRPDPNPQAANEAFQRYLDDTYDDDPTLRQALDRNEFVQARIPVNGHNDRGVPVNGLPHYLPSLRFGRALGDIANAMQQNPKLTVADVAQRWTQGDDTAHQAAFLGGLENSLGVTRDTKISDLPGQQIQRMKNSQLQYERQVMADMASDLRAKQQAQAARRPAQRPQP